MLTSPSRSFAPAAMVLLVAACSAAPSIPEPLDLRGREVCGILDDQARERLGLGPGVTDPETMGCAWRSLDDQTDLTLVLNTRAGLDPDGQRIVPPVPLTVAGRPAKRIDPLDAPTCRIVVGVAETQSFSAEAAERDTSETRPCDLAQRLATETVAALE